MATTTRIIIKRKGGHAAHHGGAWKVAYADFVTAMMALFIVLWLVNSSKAVQEAVGGYFRDPMGTAQLKGSVHAVPRTAPAQKDEMAHLKESMETAVRRLAHFKDFSKQVEFTLTSEGLRIELIENAKVTFFDLGSPVPNQNGRELLTTLAEEIVKVDNRLTVEGHTDAKPYDGTRYSNWELSTDRANAARRILTDAALADTRFFQVRGYADRKLRYKDDPENPGNRRVAIIVQYPEVETAAPGAAPPGPSPTARADSSPALSQPAHTQNLSAPEKSQPPPEPVRH